MDLAQLIQVLRDERDVIVGAPFLSLVLIAVGVIVGYLFTKILFEARLATKDSTIEHQQGRIADYQERLGFAPREGKYAKATLGAIEVSIDGHSVPINETTLKNVRELTAKKYEGFGSVLGRLEAISVHSGNEIRVWDENTIRPVVCIYPASLEETIKSNLRKRVLVSGLISYNATGQPLSCVVESIEPYEDADALPTIEQVSGVIDNLRNGVSLRDYIERLRDE